jgi:hypothetical protein
VELAQSLGTRVADLLCDGLTSARWQPVARLRAHSRSVSLPLRSDYPASMAAAREERERARLALRQTHDLAGRKRLAEEIERLSYTVDDHHFSWCGFRPEEADGQVDHVLFGMALDQVAVIGLPGEPFGAYSARLRRPFTNAAVLVAEEGNGYLSYIPGAEDFADGGYGAAAAILAPEAEGVLLGEASRIIAELLDR